MNYVKIMASAMLAALLLSGCSAPPKSAQQTVFAMDTAVSITVYGDSCDSLAASAAHKVNELSAKWSVTDQNSEIYALNSGERVQLSAETAELISFALEMNAQTGGALDITMYPVLCEWGFTTGEYKIPEAARLEELLALTGCDKITLSGMSAQLSGGAMIDLGAVAKGYTGDLLCEYLKAEGVTSALLDLGGNIHAIGAKPDGSAWRLGVKNPDGGNLAVLELTDKAAVTSGGYERCFTGDDGVRYCHILDPATGRPADSGLVSVTIVGAEGRLCDALSTAVYVMGADRAEQLWRKRGDFDMILLTDEGSLLVTSGIADSVTPTEEFAGALIVIGE